MCTANPVISSRGWKWRFLDDTGTNVECRECRTFEARRNLPRLSAPATLTLAEMFWACTRSRPVIFLIKQLEHFMMCFATEGKTCLDAIKRPGYSLKICCWLGGSHLKGCKSVPFVLLFRETKGSGLKSFLHPPAKSSTRFRELISVLPRRGWIAGKKKKRLFYQERLHCSLDNVFVSNADVFSRLC